MSGFAAAVRADPQLRAAAYRRSSPWAKAKLAIEIVLAYLRVRRLLRRHTMTDALAGLREGVREAGRPAAQTAPEHVTARRLGRAASRTLRHLPGDTRCLTQSLVLTKLLARRRIGSTLVIAVAPGEDFMAHAWLEHGGEPLLPVGSTHFGRLIEL